MLLHLQTVPARNGMLWIRHGFKVFQRKPLAMMGLYSLVLLLGLVLPGLLPLAQPLVLMAPPLVSLAFMLATHLVLQNQTPTAGVFIAPFRLTPQRRNTQLLLCLGYGVVMLLAFELSQRIDGGSWAHLQQLMTQEKPDEAALTAALGDARLFWSSLSLVLSIALISVPYWHASALVHWGGQGALQALFSSTLALWRNRGAFAYNALAWLALSFGAAVVMALLSAALGIQLVGLLTALLGVLFSVVFYASLYFSFVDCFMFGAPRDVLSDKD
jgi:hypothetical protein